MKGILSHTLPTVWQLERDDAACNSPQDDILDILKFCTAAIKDHIRALQGTVCTKQHSSQTQPPVSFRGSSFLVDGWFCKLNFTCLAYLKPHSFIFLA